MTKMKQQPTMTAHDVHKYERVKLGNKGFEVYKCKIPNCPHWIRMEFVVDKLTICHRCGDTVVMTKPMARMKKPHCIDCTNSYNRFNKSVTPKSPEEAA